MEAVLCRVEYWWRRVRRVVVGVVLLEEVMMLLDYDVVEHKNVSKR